MFLHVSVSHSVHGGGVFAIPACIAGGILACLAAGGCVLSQHALQRGGACSRGCVETPQKQTATVADGTHPTGMHAC